jgi:DNA-binding response OmpR family regulator
MTTILIAEGDESVAKLFAAVFTRQNWKVALAAHGKHAIEALRGSECYDLVLVSYDVKGSSGVELTKLVRSLAHRKNTPVLMVTGSGGIDTEALRAGASEVLHKPIDIHTLVAAVGKYVSQGSHHGHHE